jgi:PEP-CTERM motif
MQSNTLKNQAKLGTYLALTAGAGFAATAAYGATTVTFYGAGAKSPSTTPATPVGVDFGNRFGPSFYVDKAYSTASFFKFASGYFTRGADQAANGSPGYRGGRYHGGEDFANGAQLGDMNFSNVSFNGSDQVFEAVAQFHFDGTGGGYLIAIAKSTDNSALSISNGKAAIDAVPEPSALGLLALGSAGLLARRRRKLAA